MSYRYESQGRTPKSIAALAGMLLVIAGLEFIGTVWWIVVLVALISLPAALDVLLNVRSSLDLDDERLFWKNRSQEVTIPLFEI